MRVRTVVTHLSLALFGGASPTRHAQPRRSRFLFADAQPILEEIYVRIAEFRDRL